MTAHQQLIRRKHVIARVGLCWTTIKSMIDTGQFPPPLILTPHASKFAQKIAWVASDIDEWIASRPRGRPSSPVTRRTALAVNKPPSRSSRPTLLPRAKRPQSVKSS